MKNNIQKAITCLKHIKSMYHDERNSSYNGHSVCDSIHNLKKWSLQELGMNPDNYLYRNGIFNYMTALADAKETKNTAEVKMIKSTHLHWYSNYGIPNQSHDLIKANIDGWKVDALLNSMIADLAIGSYNEGSKQDLQKEAE